MGQNGPGSPQGAEFPAASDNIVPGGTQVGGQDYGGKNGGPSLSRELNGMLK